MERSYEKWATAGNLLHSFRSPDSARDMGPNYIIHNTNGTNLLLKVV